MITNMSTLLNTIKIYIICICLHIRRRHIIIKLINDTLIYRLINTIVINLTSLDMLLVISQMIVILNMCRSDYIIIYL